MNTTLVLLCGQGSCGKSTLAQKLNKKLNNSIIVRLDSIPTSKNTTFEDRLKIFISKVQEALDSQKYNYIICDCINDTIKSRQNLLSQLKFLNQIKLIVIQLRPGVLQVLKWQKQRQQTDLTKKQKENIVSTYASFQFASRQEFETYNFNDIQIYIYDNYLNTCYSEIINELFNF